MKKTIATKRSTGVRRAWLACLLACGTVASTGCSTGGMSLASMNPFSRKDTTGAPPVGFDGSEAIAKKDDKNVFSTVSSSTRDALSKTGQSITGVFTRKQAEVNGEKIAEDDPLSLTNEPDDISSEVYVANGQLWESTGNFQRAMEAYDRALETDPKDAAALASVARLHFRQNNHTEAAKHFHQAIQQNPKDAGLYNDLGLTLSRLGQHGPAVQTLQQALNLAPGTSRYVNNLASVQFESGDAAAAMKTLAEANQPAVAHFNMAYLFYRKGQVPQATQQLNLALKYEADQSADPSTRKAVERSKEMLAQIQRGTTPGNTPAQPGQPGQPSWPGASDPETRIAAAPTTPTASAPATAAQTVSAPKTDATGQLPTYRISPYGVTTVPASATTPSPQPAATQTAPAQAAPAQTPPTPAAPAANTQAQPAASQPSPATGGTEGGFALPPS
ncbi:tetratricopeptide repeat protein [Crateriforma spongiae]|uniref:tetratricopeptide repeat protein n=1 Tax=Crateriforma spongiae TaxID=2724528 RepID=UPI0014473A5C|nr:tetratricopeptide repeat protein [Crateriforma spongiae]